MSLSNSSTEWDRSACWIALVIAVAVVVIVLIQGCVQNYRADKADWYKSYRLELQVCREKASPSTLIYCLKQADSVSLG